MKYQWLGVMGLSVVVIACASLDSSLVTREPGTEAYQGNREELVKAGESLWKDPSISKSGLSCQSCHMNNAQFKKTFNQPYPHKVAMASGRAGLDEITAEQMVQLCMVIPMKTDPLPWNSRELAALSAYVEDVVQPAYAASAR